MKRETNCFVRFKATFKRGFKDTNLEMGESRMLSLTVHNLQSLFAGLKHSFVDYSSAIF